jgi:chaperone BCS1
MIISITNNDHVSYQSLLIYLKEFCGLKTEHNEFLFSRRINLYEKEEHHQTVLIPVLESNQSYSCSYDDMSFEIKEECSVEEHVATENMDIKMLKRLFITYPDDCNTYMMSLPKKVMEYKRCHFLQEELNETITHYTATQFLDWEKSDSYKKRSLDTLYLPNDVKGDLFNDLDFFYKNEQTSTLYDKMGIPQSRTYLFHGYPGTGKTTTCNVMASHLDMNIGTIDFTKDVNDNKLRIIFKNIPKNTILLIEDIDRLVKCNENFESGFSLSGLLNILDGINKVKKLICVITCNDLSVLDKALIRRIDYSIEFPNIVCDDQITYFVNNMENFFTKDDDKHKVIKFFKNKPTTINIIQKWFLLHYQNVINKKYSIVEKLSDFHTYNKWYCENSEKGLYL